MKIRTANKRRRRNFWKRKGHAHFKASRGIWLILPPELVALGAQCTLSGHEQPKFYRVYP